ncbi:MAG: hypothetical protein QOJ84_4781 [Bradyrhizobium sp.]|jgi:hypothetical protein|nr:hypothetical protein [Bradyrhizobium sp.]
MNDLTRLVFDFAIVRRAIIFNFGWAIHVSPIDHVDKIRSEGLIANKDAWIPDGLKGLVPKPNVLCLHPFGAAACPPPVCNTIENRPEIDMLTFAVHKEDIPQHVQLDWSNAWQQQELLIWRYAQLPVEEIVRRVLVEIGSFVSYDAITPDKLRVFCKGSQPANPLSWPALASCASPVTYLK